MKLELDTVKKTIKLNEDVKLGELFIILDKLLPNWEWEEFVILTNSSFVFVGTTTEVYIPYTPAPLQPYFTSPNTLPDPNFPWINCTLGTGAASTHTLNNGTFTVEIKN